eukprot:TRINITY_DN5681_c0_g1_i1.p1 TRINITY_DN5681_c0_g1~~TRINITY_DN5681_c0_g1_i1.p1  ORF type:complete len:111 (+),score=5.40 TRINITY_DN5681_c0_g1_i1:111-443(+)
MAAWLGITVRVSFSTWQPYVCGVSLTTVCRGMLLTTASSLLSPVKYAAMILRIPWCPTISTGPFCRSISCMMGSSRVITSRSVSYTHLRAHETVLDLVCRLLLEKKKMSK